MRADNQDGLRLSLIMSLMLHGVLFSGLALVWVEKVVKKASHHMNVAALIKPRLPMAVGEALVETAPRLPTIKKPNHISVPTGETIMEENVTAFGLEPVSDHEAEAVATRPSPLVLNQNDVVIPYPERAKQMFVEGVVKLRLLITKHGEVAQVAILSGPAFGLKEAAVKLAYQLRFLPATNDDGTPIDKEIDHDVLFKLRRD